MTSDLMERYLYAVTRRLPRKMRADVEAELRTLIEDMLSERCGGLPPTERDLQVVLTELGDPAELRERYMPGRKNCLIGSPYFETYKTVMKVVAVCTVFGLSVAGLISGLVEPTSNWVTGLLRWLGVVWTGLVSAFAFVTALFALLYHRDVPLGQEPILANLPPVPKRSQEIPRWEPIAELAFTAVFLGIFLLVPQLLQAKLPGSGKMVPIFQLETVRKSWYIVVLFGAAGIVRESVKLLEGRYNRRVLVTNLAADAISALLACWWLLREELLNPRLLSEISSLFPQDALFLSGLFANFQYFFLGIMLFALILDAGEAIFKTCAQ